MWLSVEELTAFTVGYVDRLWILNWPGILEGERLELCWTLGAGTL